MNTRNIIAILLIIFTLGCNADTKDTTTNQSGNSIYNNINIENTLGNFSTALTNKDLRLFLSITNSHAIYLVRKFTSGNLGGRGEPLSQSINVAKFDKELITPIKQQTPFDIPGLFINLPIKSFKELPRYTLSSDIETTHYDQWEPILKKSLKNAPEAKTGTSALLSSNNSKYWIYAEAQIIDDILVGGFAVFSPEGDKLKLVAIIELL